MSLENTDALMHRLKANDKSVLKLLFDRHYESVCQSIFRLLKDRSQVKDLAQNVFIRFWEKRQQLNVKTSFGAYFHRMAVNEALMYLRKNKNWKIEEIDLNIHTKITPDVEENYLQSELEDKITEAIHSLPPKCQLVFQLSRYEELTYKEIAEKLDISVKTVENQMGKALRVLRQKMKGYLE